MRKIVVSEFVSLDGVMEDPGGAEGFEHGGWTMKYWGDDIAKVKWDELHAADAQLLGRVTYQGFAAAWPTMSDSFADRMNGMPKYVVSSTLTNPTWNNSHVITGDVAREIARLKQEPGHDILVAGSAALAQFLMQHELVDLYRLLVYPVVLGSGKRLFKDKHTPLKLLNTQPMTSGVVLLEYEPER